MTPDVANARDAHGRGDRSTAAVSGGGRIAAEASGTAPGSGEPALAGRLADFRAGYAVHRAAEGRRAGRAELLALPYLATGPVAGQWRVRARTYHAFERRVLRPLADAAQRPLDVLDLGAGNGWLCYRAALLGHRALALDVRDDDVDGLGAAAGYLEDAPGLFRRVVASFEALPLARESFDVAVFNASLHYALELGTALEEAARMVRRGGRIVVLDSPFYAHERAGAAMVAEKRAQAAVRFGELADALLSLPFIEFLTPERLDAAGAGLGLRWRRHRVRYPLRYEMRPLVARLTDRRPPSRFDLWECTVS